jgi:predicted transcriptional regulator
MLAQWIGEIVGQMHNNKISKTQLADHMGVSREYVSMILNGHRCPAGAEERFRAAVNEMAVEKAGVYDE